MCGTLPFPDRASTQKQAYADMVSAGLHLPDTLSAPCRDLLSRLLQVGEVRKEEKWVVDDIWRRSFALFEVNCAV